MSLSIYLNFLLDLLVLFVFSVGVVLENIYRLLVPKTPKSLKGEIVLVTGGANGIGREVCVELARREKDLTIVIWDIDEESIASTVAELEGLGVKRAVGAKVDVSERAEVKSAAEQIKAEIGDVSLLFNNAGITGEVATGWLNSPESIEKVLGVNFLSHCWTFQELLPAMVRKGKGHVVEMCSVLGILHSDSASAYIASKHALNAYTECIKEDVRKLPHKPQVHFTTVYPNHTKTQMMAPFHLTTKYPFLEAISTAQEVAHRIIDGVEVNEEHIYFPYAFRFMPTIIGMMPPSVLRRGVDMLRIAFITSKPNHK